jgi:2'-5' RNA ligase
VSNLVIVAIPDENDHVWKVSSEKVPHLTVLFLGDVDQISNLETVVQFVEHAANTTLNRFYLPVDRRGELGADKADVLFFKKGRYDYKAIRDFRVSLLQNNNIKTAYDSAQQFEGPWNPHLTLGYPEDPAKEEDPEFGFYSVYFNKIAVWTGDFEGPEFLLTDEWDEFEALETVPMDVAMSDIRHHGVKGMKWGVRKIKAGAKAVGRSLAALGAHLADSSWQNSTYSDIKHEAVHNHVAQKLDNRVERLQRSPKYRGKDLKADRDLRHEYRQDVAKVSNAAYRTAVKETYGENYTGTKTAHFVKDIRGARIEVRNKKSGETEAEAPLSSMKEIKKRRKAEAEAFGLGHADISNAPDLVIELKEDTNEQIIGVGFVKPSNETLTQSAVDLGAEFILEHYGIKGMHWGQRKAREVSTQSHVDSGVFKRRTEVRSTGGEAHDAHPDAVTAAVQKQKLKKSGTNALSTQELRELANRLQVENQVSILMSSKGKQFVSKQLEQEGKAALRKGTQKAAPHVIRRASKGAATVATTAALL